MSNRSRPVTESEWGIKPNGRLDLVVRSRQGRVEARRQVRNIVLQGGAELIAQLFSGAGGAGPIDRILIGFGHEAATANATALTPPDDAGVPASALETLLPPGSFVIDTGGAGKVSVAVNAVFSPTLELPDVTEAALAANDRLYNQVVFEPITLRVGQDVTFFWQIEFPYG